MPRAHRHSRAGVLGRYTAGGRTSPGDEENASNQETDETEASTPRRIPSESLLRSDQMSAQLRSVMLSTPKENTARGAERERAPNVHQADRMRPLMSPIRYNEMNSAITQKGAQGITVSERPDRLVPPECVHCRVMQKGCVWPLGQSSCLDCQKAKRKCIQFLPIPSIKPEYLDVIATNLDSMPVSDRSRDFFQSVYGSKELQIDTSNEWIQYKQCVLRDKAHKLSIRDVQAHQLRDLTQALIPEIPWSDPKEDLERPARTISQWIRELDDRTYINSTKRSVTQSPQRIELSSLARILQPSSFPAVTHRLSRTNQSDSTTERRTPSSDLSGTDSTADTYPFLDVQDLASIKVFSTILFRLALPKLQVSFFADSTSPKSTAVTERSPQASNQGASASETHNASGRNRHNTQSILPKKWSDPEECEDGDGCIPPPSSNQNQKPADSISTTRLFACPFYKFDPYKYSEETPGAHLYYRCGACVLGDIAAVKKHLERHHARPEVYCPKCWDTFKDSDDRDAHVLLWRCDERSSPFEDRMSPDQAARIKHRRRGGDPVKVWYDIFRILFPGADSPATPYLEGRRSEMLRLLIAVFSSYVPEATRIYNNMSIRLSTELAPQDAFIVQRALNFVVTDTAVLAQTGASFEDSLSTLVNSTSRDYASYTYEERSFTDTTAIRHAHTGNAFMNEEDGLVNMAIPNDFDREFAREQSQITEDSLALLVRPSDEIIGTQDYGVDLARFSEEH